MKIVVQYTEHGWVWSIHDAEDRVLHEGGPCYGEDAYVEALRLAAKYLFLHCQDTGQLAMLSPGP
ncbi:hypothetical protein EBT31_11305 [bacterium]|nr:hypothetical protein [bacterium]